MIMDQQNKHLGSSLDDLLAETGELSEVTEEAIQRVNDWEDNQ